MKIKNRNMEAKTQIEEWQKGNDSSLSPLTRVEMMNDWLKKNKQDILLNTKERLPLEPEKEFSGFIDID